jgi:hypothetical protein
MAAAPAPARGDKIVCPPTREVDRKRPPVKSELSEVDKQFKAVADYTDAQYAHDIKENTAVVVYQGGRGMFARPMRSELKDGRETNGAADEQHIMLDRDERGHGVAAGRGCRMVFPKGFKLMDHQLLAVSHMMTHDGLVLWWTVGSGKTAASLAASLCLMSQHQDEGWKTLVVTTKTVRNTGVFERGLRQMGFLPQLSAEEEKRKKMQSKKEFPITMIYRGLIGVTHHEAFKDLVLKDGTLERGATVAFTDEEGRVKMGTLAFPAEKTILIVDEAHKYKKAMQGKTGSKRNALVDSIFRYGNRCAKIMLMTGTPMPDQPQDLVNLVALARKCEPIYTVKDKTVSMYRQFNDILRDLNNGEDIDNNNAKLKDFLQCVLSIFRTDMTMPYRYPFRIYENIAFIPMTDAEFIQYCQAEYKINKGERLDAAVNPRPFFTGLKDVVNGRLVAASKLQFAVEKALNYAALGEPVIIYNQMVKSGLERLEDLLQKEAKKRRQPLKKGEHYVVLTGEVTSARQRDEIAMKLRLGPKAGGVNIMLMSRAAEEGLDLTMTGPRAKSKKHIIITQPNWHTGGERQAIGRFYRFNMGGELIVERMYSVKPLAEEQISERTGGVLRRGRADLIKEFKRIPEPKGIPKDYHELVMSATARAHYYHPQHRGEESYAYNKSIPDVFPSVDEYVHVMSWQKDVECTVALRRILRLGISIERNPNCFTGCYKGQMKYDEGGERSKWWADNERRMDANPKRREYTQFDEEQDCRRYHVCDRPSEAMKDWRPVKDACTGRTEAERAAALKEADKYRAQVKEQNEKKKKDEAHQKRKAEKAEREERKRKEKKRKKEEEKEKEEEEKKEEEEEKKEEKEERKGKKRKEKQGADEGAGPKKHKTGKTARKEGEGDGAGGADDGGVDDAGYESDDIFSAIKRDGERVAGPSADTGDGGHGRGRGAGVGGGAPGGARGRGRGGGAVGAVDRGRGRGRGGGGRGAPGGAAAGERPSLDPAALARARGVLEADGLRTGPDTASLDAWMARVMGLAK